MIKKKKIDFPTEKESIFSILYANNYINGCIHDAV